MNEFEFKILFACIGSICRRPTAEAVFQKRFADVGLSRKVKVDSAGKHNFHPSTAPDERAQRHALQRGYDYFCLKARPVVESDFEQFVLQRIRP